jgi:hypothetical protein
MTPSSDTRLWEREENEALAIAFVIGTFFAFPVAAFTPEYGICSGFLVFLAITWAVYKLQKRRRFTVSKVFLVRRHVAHEIVERVLQEKGIPYQNVHGRFQLNDSHLSIQVDEGYIGPSPFWQVIQKRGMLTTQQPGSRIKIHPLEAENTQIIIALRHKIDEAFAPRGLP